MNTCLLHFAFEDCCDFVLACCVLQKHCDLFVSIVAVSSMQVLTSFVNLLSSRIVLLFGVACFWTTRVFYIVICERIDLW